MKRLKVKPLYLYYGFLLVVLCSWMSSGLPPMSLRFAFLLLVLAPLPFTQKSFLPCILSTFVIISTNRHSPSFMPVMPEFLLVATALMLPVGKKWMTKKKESGDIITDIAEDSASDTKIYAPWPLWLMAMYTFIVNRANGGSLGSNSLVILLIILFFGFYKPGIVLLRSHEMSLSFVLISIILCVEVWLFGDQFVFNPSASGTEERISYNDPNYFTCIIGMGVVAALAMLLYEKHSKRTSYLLLGFMLFVIVTALKVASRGGMLAMAGAVVTMLVLSRRSNQVASKIVWLFLLTGVILYAVGAFDLLFTRFSEDEGELGGRSVLWMSKLTDFVSQATFKDWFVGMGRERALSLAAYLGDKDVMGFHNDYIAFLACYGILGLSVLVTFLLYPIFRYKNPVISAGIVFIIIAAMSLEPISVGALDFFYFYFYLCVLGICKEIEGKPVAVAEEAGL